MFQKQKYNIYKFLKCTTLIVHNLTSYRNLSFVKQTTFQFHAQYNLQTRIVNSKKFTQRNLSHLVKFNAKLNSSRNTRVHETNQLLWSNSRHFYKEATRYKVLLDVESERMSPESRLNKVSPLIYVKTWSCSPKDVWTGVLSYLSECSLTVLPESLRPSDVVNIVWRAEDNAGDRQYMVCFDGLLVMIL